MLHRIHIAAEVPMQNQPISESSNGKYNRNAKDDMKKAVELLFEFKENLDKLHPTCIELISAMLQQRY